jgi:GNAT superfamily N-acetyltransferase
MVRVRRATSDDAAAIAAIHAEAYERGLGEVVDRAVLDAARLQRRPLWDALLADPPAGQAVFVAEDDEVVGFVSTGPDRDPASGPEVGEIYALFVDPARWRGGVGGALLDTATEYLRTIGVSDARLWVLDANDRARRFYEARGWSDLGIERVDERGRFLRLGRSL